MLFTFDNKVDVDTILANQPRSFDKNLLVLQRYDKDMGTGDLPFWVQVHGIPVRFMNQRVAQGTCETVDITQPLRRGRVISKDENKEQRVSFKYERLPNLCYWCDCFTHNDRDRHLARQ